MKRHSKLENKLAGNYQDQVDRKVESKKKKLEPEIDKKLKNYPLRNKKKKI